MKKTRTTAKKTTKRATAESALIQALVQRDLESLEVSCGGTVLCSLNLCR